MFLEMNKIDTLFYKNDAYKILSHNLYDKFFKDYDGYKKQQIFI